MRTLTFSLQQECILAGVSFEFNKKVTNGILHRQMSDLCTAVFLFQTSLRDRVHSILHASALLCTISVVPLTAEGVSVVYSMNPVDTTSSLVHTK